METVLLITGIKISALYDWGKRADALSQLLTRECTHFRTHPTSERTDGKLELQPLQDPDTVNERRAALNMDTVEEGLAKMAQGVCR